MKKAFILCLILVLILIPAGCKSPSEMAAEKLTEKVLEDITGGKVNVDGEKVTIETEDGSELSLGGNEWPKDKLGKAIPKLDGKVTYVANSDALCMITVEGIKTAEFEKYLEKVKDAGYTQNEVSYSDSSSKAYMATNADDIAFQLTYLIESEEVTITVGKNQK
ncbi:MAG: hypothetical protein GX207_11860 [Peptococcaceae bacterium]|jgi:N-acetylneuraminic acid mutarotase|nr:hypothetical protein [Peptococcaceae bacterium]NLM22414.1 hypothetical protein [Peptococcaceae bacterium]